MLLQQYEVKNRATRAFSLELWKLLFLSILKLLSKNILIFEGSEI
jgi:hypothetical protein